MLKFKRIQIWMWVHTSETYFSWGPHLCFETNDLTKVTHIHGAQTGSLQGVRIRDLVGFSINQEQIHVFTVRFHRFQSNNPACIINSGKTDTLQPTFGGVRTNADLFRGPWHENIYRISPLHHRQD